MIMVKLKARRNLDHEPSKVSCSLRNGLKVVTCTQSIASNDLLIDDYIIHFTSYDYMDTIPFVTVNVLLIFIENRPKLSNQ